MGAPLVVAGVVAGVAVAIGVNEACGRPAPFLRWSFIRMMLGMKKLMTDWQVGDGREDAVADYVIEHARPGDVDHAIATIDEFAYKHSFLINVGDEKGAILELSRGCTRELTLPARRRHIRQAIRRQHGRDT